MLALVKKPSIEISLHGERVDDLIEWIKKKFEVSILTSDMSDSDINKKITRRKFVKNVARDEYLPNLKKIREMGVQEWVKYEEERWRCPRCGQLMSWYDAECAGCGEPRSEKLFPLTEK